MLRVRQSLADHCCASLSQQGSASFQVLYQCFCSAGTAHQQSHDACMPPAVPETVSLELPTYMIWGANTAVGKTLVSAGIAASAAADGVNSLCRLTPLACMQGVWGPEERGLFAQAPLLYLKPVQTGFPDDSDAALVVRPPVCAQCAPS